VKVLGVDPGTAACGWGIVVERHGRLRGVAHGSWTTKPSLPLAERLLAIFERVAGVLAEHEPDAVALEESFVGADARTALSVGQARGAILVACANAGLPCDEYAPARVKKSVCGFGRADKAQVQRMVSVLLALPEPPTPHHAADALAIAICRALEPPLLRAAV
jgi:crossover junction endodeoxyribonuclease RuvC